MKIGTPLSSSATKVMLLGCGELGKEVLIALQRLGVETIGVDRYPHAPGHQVAHRSYVIQMTDGAALKEIIDREKPHFIVPEIEAIATPVLLEIEKEGLATVIPTARAAFLTMNREEIRRLAAEELDLPTSRYVFAEELNELQTLINRDIGFPCIIKPVMSSSGKGQSFVKSFEEIETAWHYAMDAGRVNCSKVIAESVIEFDYEITLLTVRAKESNGEIKTHFCEPIGHIQIGGDYVESWQPHSMSEKALEKAQHIAKTITTALGGQGIFGVELFVKGEEVYFSEVSPRPHDTGMVTMISQVQNEFELHARALLGLPVSTQLRRSGASAVIYGGMNEKGIAFENIEQALSIPETDLRLFGKPESFIKRRMGVALASGDSTEQARERAKACANLIKPVK
ncbi:MAG: phosphoribosylglycinamide formyltransferase 2 [Pseudomonadota bacterium]|jgi:phosphoribosylglycinamide formyltransferase 2